MDWFNKRVARKLKVPSAEQAIPGRDQPIEISGIHAVLNTPMKPPFPEGSEVVYFGMGCFWGAERRFWLLPGVYTTAVGYGGGITKNPTYEEVCSGMTGHTELVMVVFDPKQLAFNDVLKTFWESHDPCQGMRQGNDVGTQYRSFIGCTHPQQQQVVDGSFHQYQKALSHAGHGDITTEIQLEPAFYYAEEYHQQYLHKNPNGYCGLAGTGVPCGI